MLTSLEIERFRCFRSFTLDRLARVNLVVGVNNAGKTALLEAAEILLQRGDPAVFWRQARRRGEMIRAKDPEREQAEVVHLFHGRAPKPGSVFHIRGTQRGEPEEVTGRIEPRRADQSPLSFTPRHVEVTIAGGNGAPPEALAGLSFSIDSKAGTWRHQMTPAYGLVPVIWAAYDRQPAEEPVRFLDSHDADDSEDLGMLWDEVVLTEEEPKVADALRIIEPTVDRIAFARHPASAYGDFFLKLAGAPDRVPLGSMGDGLERLLGISLHLARSARGATLIDEIDTGLHHSVMVRMWRLVVETARRLDLQVFATTHSLDCVLALAELCERFPELSGEVLLHRIDRGSEAPATYAADALRVAAEQHMEVRGHAAEAE